MRVRSGRSYQSPFLSCSFEHSLSGIEDVVSHCGVCGVGVLFVDGVDDVFVFGLYGAQLGGGSAQAEASRDVHAGNDMGAQGGLNGDVILIMGGASDLVVQVAVFLGPQMALSLGS